MRCQQCEDTGVVVIEAPEEEGGGTFLCTCPAGKETLQGHPEEACSECGGVGYIILNPEDVWEDPHGISARDYCLVACGCVSFPEQPHDECLTGVPGYENTGWLVCPCYSCQSRRCETVQRVWDEAARMEWEARKWQH